MASAMASSATAQLQSVPQSSMPSSTAVSLTAQACPAPPRQGSVPTHRVGCPSRPLVSGTPEEVDPGILDLNIPEEDCLELNSGLSEDGRAPKT